MFDSPTKLVLGLLTGFVFGFLLQKGRVAKFETIAGQFLLRDWTVVKMMGTAVVVGAIGVYALLGAGMATLHVRPLLFGGVLSGAILFGIGMAILGYCPGTCIAGCGEGRRDAMSGLLGMFGGAALFVAIFPLLTPFIRSLGDWGEITFPEATHTSPWPWIATLAATGIIAFFFERSRRTKFSVSKPESTSKPFALDRN